MRRHYPFFPAIGGRVAEPFEWRDRRFAERDWVLFDVYGTDRDPRVWAEPQRFLPRRFIEQERVPVAQGVGPFAESHRCPGEPATVALLQRFAASLTALRYDVPSQDLTIDLSRLPARPASGFIIAGVR